MLGGRAEERAADELACAGCPFSDMILLSVTSARWREGGGRGIRVRGPLLGISSEERMGSTELHWMVLDPTKRVPLAAKRGCESEILFLSVGICSRWRHLRCVISPRMRCGPAGAHVAEASQICFCDDAQRADALISTRASCRAPGSPTVRILSLTAAESWHLGRALLPRRRAQ